MANGSDPAPLKLEFDAKLTNLFQQKGFAVERLISKGAFGQVYQGTNLNTGQQVAIKVMFLEAMKPVVKEKFISREIEILKQISHASHPHIVYISNIMLASKKLFIFMEYAKAGDLAGYMKQNGVLSEPQTALWFGQVSSALHFLHIEQRLAHRDIKLDNVLLFGDQLELAKLADFGFATEAWDWQRQQPLLSRSWCGTRPYYCPQILMFTPYNAFAADCYSMGVMLFFMLNGFFPFHFQSSKLMFREQTDPGYLRTRYIKQFPGDLIDLLVGLLTVEERIRLDIRQVMQHPWIKRGGK